jgi:hypothetical protein
VAVVVDTAADMGSDELVEQWDWVVGTVCIVDDMLVHHNTIVQVCHLCYVDRVWTLSNWVDVALYPKNDAEDMHARLAMNKDGSFLHVTQPLSA